MWRCGHSSCHMLKNLFELIALKGTGDGKILGRSTPAKAQGFTLAPTASARAQANELPSETFTNIFAITVNRSDWSFESNRSVRKCTHSLKCLTQCFECFHSFL